jgi:hypothetical protein
MDWTADRSAGLARLAAFAPHAGRTYAANRNFDDGVPEKGARDNVSQLSPWLHAGLLVEREVIAAALAEHSHEDCDQFVAEVFWRVYFKGYLEQRPSIWRAYVAERDAALAALDTEPQRAEAYARATRGRTGIAAFDHWARELAATGYLHNHARMWTASIWIFTLRLDWQLGADWFLRHLLDGDAASNTLSWRWVAGLHTKGKHYLAQASNITRFTERMEGGPLEAKGLVEEAKPLTEEPEHQREELDLPDMPGSDAFDAPFALLLHDEGASHVPLDLPAQPALVIGAARPVARSPGAVGEGAACFARNAVSSGMAEAASAFGCEAREWVEGESLADLLSETGIERFAVPHLPQGWTRDALWPELVPYVEAGRTITLLSDLNRTAWPHARAGFFKVKKAIPDILAAMER